MQLGGWGECHGGVKRGELEILCNEGHIVFQNTVRKVSGCSRHSTGTSPPHISGTDSRFSLCDQSLTSEQFPCFTNGVDAEIFFELTTHSIHPFIVPVKHIVETRRESRDIRL
ncbi:hypothetical protein VOLCADRAFT_107559 [Volvox carteri f. nagariensis]|uniref:Uncharacterized protein n=1 Tax=Volvox carteri f. nagariensis TaxID=3068 RepID=D8UET4_VOLCA|nr:uncharacterized protein VOLCADRAFT_107559 [Volvox carteri f. nagariensis]EFJ41788.1 hypothetical protein VOLCADRAFT_107559 [Volvox carteri f. nagariensis]|eukprot:XP_002957134.1 hypothetical protein VOLCADRAFT_107559 [Volvox carteri f. nagariensis]